MGMHLGLHNIQVNTASIADGHSLAAYLTSAAGTLITSEVIAAKNYAHSKGPESHIDGSAYATTVDYLSSMGVVNNAGNWVPLTLNAAGELPVAATVNFAGDYPEDSPHVSADVGLFSLAVRRDTRTSGTSADGDYASFNVNTNGELWTKDADTYALLQALSKAEDATAASGDQGIQSLLVRQDTLASSTSADGDYGSFKSNAAGELYVVDATARVSLASIVTNTANTASNTSTISSTLTALSKAEDAAAASGDQGIQSLLVRQDTLASSTSADGDYGSFKSNATGELYTVDSTLRSLITALSKSEDAVHSSGDQGFQALAVRKDAQGSNVSADGDYASMQQWSEGSLKVVDIANATILQSQVSVTDTATLLPATPISNRKTLMIQNTGANKLWIGSATVTTIGATAGIEMAANSFMELEVGPAVNVYGIKNGATGNTVNLLQLA